MTAEDTRRRRELARVTVIEIVERAVANEHMETIADVFSWLTGALEIDDETSTRWRETLRSKRTLTAGEPAGEPAHAMLPNGYHPGARCSCRDCLRAYR